jgi:hypothetical protein
VLTEIARVCLRLKLPGAALVASFEQRDGALGRQSKLGRISVVRAATFGEEPPSEPVEGSSGTFPDSGGEVGSSVPELVDPDSPFDEGDVGKPVEAQFAPEPLQFAPLNHNTKEP